MNLTLKYRGETLTGVPITVMHLCFFQGVGKSQVIQLLPEFIRACGKYPDLKSLKKNQFKRAAHLAGPTPEGCDYEELGSRDIKNSIRRQNQSGQPWLCYTHRNSPVMTTLQRPQSKRTLSYIIFNPLQLALEGPEQQLLRKITDHARYFIVIH